MRHLNNIALVLLFSLPLKLYADPAQELAILLESLNSMQATFEQTTLNSDGDTINTSRGNLALKNGGYFRIETTEPFPQLLIADGKDFYSFDADLEQVIVKTLERDVKQVPILLFGNSDQSFLQDYHVTQVDEKTHSQFILEPQTAEGIFELLVLKFRGANPSSMVMRDSLGQTTEIKLSVLTVNTEIADSEFDFLIPKGIDLIDDR
tara:strand:+ start:9335 stop:9955 length:621 start_codon:yes stop_codon:yes gene_type:complete